MDTQISVRIEGLSPLLLHKVPDSLLFPEGGNSGGKPGKARAVFGGQEDTPRLQAEASLYMSNGNSKAKPVPIMPGPNLFRCIIEGGRFHKLGRNKVTTRDSSLVAAGVMIQEIEIPIIFTKPWEVHSRMVTNQAIKAKIPSHRPRFDEWALEFTLLIDTTVFDLKLVRAIVDDAGKKIGLGSHRPDCKGPFGRFVVTSWEKVTDKKKR